MSQQRIEGTEAIDEVGKAAEKFIQVKDRRDLVVEEMAEAESALIAELKKAGRDSIRVAGMLLSLRHKDASDSIGVKKAKDEE